MSRALLLDTQPLLWWLAGGPIAGQAAEAIADPSTVVAVSAASIWEIAIKRRLGKLTFEGSPVEEVRRAGFAALPVSADHSERAGDLPLHHGDPFDRMLVAQAQAEGMTLVTRDPAMGLYDVRLLRC